MSRIKNEENVMNKSFTMSEILISLTIIGVIAAIVIPSLIGKLNEKVWANQRKALYSRMSQAIAMMPKLAGYGEYEGTWGGTWSSPTVTVTKDTAAMTFVTDGLSKVMKINNICDNSNFDKCGIPSEITDFGGNKKDFPKKLSDLSPYYIGKAASQETIALVNPQKNINTEAAALTTVNGESVAVFYNPQCVSHDVKYSLGRSTDNNFINAYSILPYMCAVFLYDLNGKKGPNAVGKDIWFMDVIYADEPVVSTFNPEKLIAKGEYHNYSDVLNYCNSKNARLPNEFEAITFYMVNSIVGTADMWLNTGSNINNYRKYVANGIISDKFMTAPYGSYTCTKR